MKVLIAEDDPMVRKYLVAITERYGYQCIEAHDGAEALKLYAIEQPDLILTDIQMPEMDGFTLLKDIRDQNNEVIVIIITAEGSEDTAVRALQLGANNYLHKPVADKQLRHLLRQYATIISERVVTHELEQTVDKRTLSVSIDNRIDNTTRIAQFLVNESRQMLTEKQRMDIILGLDELLSNAIEHGNLFISQEEKEQALYQPDGIHALHAKRLADPAVAKRRVHIEFTYLRGEYCEWVLTDEGNGFDWRAVPSPVDEEGIYKPCGRGIFLGRMVFDHVEYRGKGNVVCVRKNFPRQDTPSTPCS